MPVNDLLRLAMDLNSRLSTTMRIADTLTKSEGQLRMDIEAVLGYKRFSPTELQPLAITSIDSGLGLLGILSVGRAPDAQAIISTPPRTRQESSNKSPNNRRRLTISMRGKPRLEDLMEEEPETGNPRQPFEKSPIRRSDRQHSLAQGRSDRTGEAATLPRARSLRNFQTYEGRKVRIPLPLASVPHDRALTTYHTCPGFPSIFQEQRTTTQSAKFRPPGVWERHSHKAQALPFAPDKERQILL